GRQNSPRRSGGSDDCEGDRQRRGQGGRCRGRWRSHQEQGAGVAHVLALEPEQRGRPAILVVPAGGVSTRKFPAARGPVPGLGAARRCPDPTVAGGRSAQGRGSGISPLLTEDLGPYLTTITSRLPLRRSTAISTSFSERPNLRSTEALPTRRFWISSSRKN